jgi:hypothetical protein
VLNGFRISSLFDFWENAGNFVVSWSEVISSVEYVLVFETRES